MVKQGEAYSSHDGRVGTIEPGTQDPDWQTRSYPI
jgi:hypothetical protein